MTSLKMHGSYKEVAKCSRVSIGHDAAGCNSSAVSFALDNPLERSRNTRTKRIKQYSGERRVYAAKSIVW